MKYDEFEKIRHEASSEKFNYLCIGMIYRKMKVNIVFTMRAEPQFLNVFPNLNLFEKNKGCFRIKV